MSGFQKKVLITTAISGGIFGLFLLVNPFKALASDCPNREFSSQEIFFDAYESHEYVDGLLRLHFKLNLPSRGEQWNRELRLFDDECERAYVPYPPYLYGVSILPGVREWSVRFSSRTHFDIWNDETNTKETCALCSEDLDEFPLFDRFSYYGSYGGSNFLSAAYYIVQPPTAPPTAGVSLPTPPGCRPFETNGGYFFDNYEFTEYRDGQLIIHFRLKSPYNDGRPWSFGIYAYNENCRLIDSVYNFYQKLTVKRHSKYFSVRFTSPETFEIWNDETNTKEICPNCSFNFGNFHGLKPKYLSFYGTIDGQASYFFSTQLSPLAPVSKPDPVIIVPGILGSAEKDGVWLIDPIFHTYDDLIATLAANGYVEGQNLFSFPYDWRFSNVLTAVALKDKIAEVKNICHCAKVDLVAHSMGGLAARQYIQSSQYANDVDQLIFLGTPHLGAPKAYLPWEGATMPFNITDQGIKTLLWWEAKKLGLSLFDYIHQSVLSIRELLPVYNYLTLSDTGVTENYPNGYPANPFLENLSDGTNTLLNSGVTITNFVGSTGTSTISSILVSSSTDPILWGHGKPDELNNGIGDETVPIGSASFIDKDVNFSTSTHMNLPFDTRGLVYQKLTGKTAELVGNGPHLDALMLIKILSPADIVVIAPDNKRIGKDFATGQEVNEIDGAFYSGFLTDDEYITIPNPLLGEYKVVTQGTGEGSYTLASSYIGENFSTETDFVGQTTSGMINEINLQIATSSLDVKITPEDIVADIGKCLELGWIDNKGIANSLIKKKKDKAFLNELNAQRGKHINEQAYQLLSEDIKWLLSTPR